MVLVAGAQDNGVHLALRAVHKMRSAVFQAGQQRRLVERVRPVVPHGGTAVAEGHRFGTVLVALRADVFG